MQDVISACPTHSNTLVDLRCQVGDVRRPPNVRYEDLGRYCLRALQGDIQAVDIDEHAVQN